MNNPCLEAPAASPSPSRELIITGPDFTGEETAVYGRAELTLHGNQIGICYAEHGDRMYLDADHAAELGLLLSALSLKAAYRPGWRPWRCDRCCTVIHGPSIPKGWKGQQSHPTEAPEDWLECNVCALEAK